MVLDELHSLVTSKRGHLLSLALARIRRHAPAMRTIGLSATVAEPMDLQRYLAPQVEGERGRADHSRWRREAEYRHPADGGAHSLVRPFGALRHAGFIP